MPRQDWSVENVKDWEKLHSSHVEIDITEALAWYLLDIGIGQVNEKNFPEILLRIREVEDVIGARLRLRAADGSYPLTPIHADSIRRRFGMWANVTPRTKAAFRKLIDKERQAKADHEAKYGSVR